MGTGAELAIPLMAKIVGSAAGGGGQQAAPGAPQPGPFDALSNPAARPPMPEQNPMLHSDPEEASLIASKRPPMPEHNAAFSGGVPMPEMNPMMHPSPEELAQLAPFSGGVMDTGGAGQTVGKSTPMIGPSGELNNTDLAKRAGYKVDTVYGTDVTGQTAPSRGRAEAAVIEPKVAGPWDDPNPDETAPVQSMTEKATPARGKPEVSTAFDFEKDPKNPDTMTRIKFDQGDPNSDHEYDDEGDEPSAGIFGPAFGGALGDLQDKLGDSATNPMFQVGMGLLSSGYDGSNPWTQMNKGLSAVPGHQLAAQAGQNAESASNRANAEETRKAEEERVQKMISAGLMLQIQKMQAAQQGPNIARGSAKVIR